MGKQMVKLLLPARCFTWAVLTLLPQCFTAEWICKFFSSSTNILINLLPQSTALGVQGGASQTQQLMTYFRPDNQFFRRDGSISRSAGSFKEMSCWMVSRERRADRIRGLYLRTLLRQDIEFFDTRTTTGEDGFYPSLAFLHSCTCHSRRIHFIAYGEDVESMTSCLCRCWKLVEQTVGAIRTVVSFTGENKATEKYDRKLQIAYASTVQKGLALGIELGTVLLIVLSTYGLVIWYGSKLIIEKRYSGGEVINIMMAIMTGGISLGQTSPCINAFAAGQAAAYKIFEAIEWKSKIDAYDDRGIVLENIRGKIELKDVYFTYPARPEIQIFSGFSLHIVIGETAVVVGQSGSGKSTVICLLERFYDPDAGEVLINGVNLKMLKLKWIGGKMGLVRHACPFFSTLALTREEIILSRLPGLDTVVDEHGTQLSGGQKQRFAIARAILKNPKILLLDEATSALDAESERLVHDALEN
ncbi:unnamed protein product [Fraxinus pennsylvanica]|uniref:Uncharacterized protein n=1 Tax=Fraxinus pennsylvanica TaxID=56036 RepID=A0AAD2A8Z7_9LAMI|nr:unnamed protein product [Fraxinus pennsylvanica]